MRFRNIGRPLVLFVGIVVALAGSATAATKPVAVDLGTLGGTYSAAIAVNDTGQVVGNSSTAGDAAGRGFSWTPSSGMIDLGTLGGTVSVAEGMNATGQAVGYSITAAGEQHAFLWTPSVGMIDLGTLGGTYSFAKAVNANGQVVGFSGTTAGEPHAFSWTQSDGMIDLGTLGGTFSIALAVTADGQAVGYGTIAGDTTMHAFSWTRSGGMIDLGTLGGNNSSAQAVNAHGQVVGTSGTTGDTAPHAFSWTQSDGMIDLGTLGGTYSSAIAVNDNGQVVGGSGITGAGAHAFSWTRSGGMIDLGTLGGNLSGAQAVNARGQVVGYGCTDCGPFPVTHAFSWTQGEGMIDLGTLGGNNSYPQAVNASGQVVGSSTTTGGEEHAVLWQQRSGSFSLHGSGGTANPPILFLDRTAPTGSTPKYKDSPAVKVSGGNPWKEIGTWIAAPELADGFLSTIGDADVWVGLKNSDDQGTRFDLRIEVLKNASELVVAGEVRCIEGVTRNPANAKEVVLTPPPFSPVPFDGSADVLSLRVLIRIGSGGSCVGHSSAVGLRLYFDAVSRKSMIEAVEFGRAAP